MVKTGFLHGDLEKEIYMSQPYGFEVASKENWVCKLKKSFYGLKLFPRLWYKRFDHFMIGKSTLGASLIIVYIFVGFLMDPLSTCFYMLMTCWCHVKTR